MNRLEQVIKVECVNEFEIRNRDLTETLARVEKGEMITAELYEPTEEYFGQDSKGRRVYVGQIDFKGDLVLDVCFLQVVGGSEDD